MTAVKDEVIYTTEVSPVNSDQEGEVQTLLEKTFGNHVYNTGGSLNFLAVNILNFTSTSVGDSIGVYGVGFDIVNTMIGCSNYP